MEIKVRAESATTLRSEFVTQGQLPLVTFSLAYTPRSRKGNEWVDGEAMWFRVAQFGRGLRL
jgi:single-stranded DNA-binding protein